MPNPDQLPDVTNLPVFCVVCTGEVPPERVRRKSVTCCDEHKTLREKSLRQRKELRRCKYCHTPGSPEQRHNYMRWARTRAAAARGKTFPAFVAELPAILSFLKERGVTVNPREVRNLIGELLDTSTADQPPALPDMRERKGETLTVEDELPAAAETDAEEEAYA